MDIRRFHSAEARNHVLPTQFSTTGKNRLCGEFVRDQFRPISTDHEHILDVPMINVGLHGDHHPLLQAPRVITRDNGFLLMPLGAYAVTSQHGLAGHALSTRRYSAATSDDNSTEVCIIPLACDSRPIPLCSLAVVQAKYFRFQSNDVIRTSENSRNFRVCGKRHLKTASFAENTNVQNSQKLRPWAASKSVASLTIQMSAMSPAAAGSMIRSESMPSPAMSAAHATAAAAKSPV